MKRLGIGKWISCILICALLVGMVIPSGNKAEAASDKKTATKLIMSQDSKAPTGYDEGDTTNPLGENEEQPFMLSTQNELMFYVSRDGKYNTYTLDNYNSAKDDLLQYKDKKYFAKNINRANTTYSELADPFTGYAYLQATAFDPDGNGRSEYVAYVGASKYPNASNKNYVDVIVQNTRTGKYASMHLGSTAWLALLKPESAIAGNFFTITAGDYDDDGKDTVIVYFPADFGKGSVIEVEYNDADNTLSVKNNSVCSVKNERNYKGSGTLNSINEMPIVSLVSGDFDGDDVDEFAVSIGIENYSDDAKDGADTYVSSPDEPSTKVIVYDYDGKWNKAASYNMSDMLELKYQDKNSKQYSYRYMHGGSLGAGDVDGDGIDEIIAVGYTSHDSGKAAIVYEDWSVSGGKSVIRNLFDWDQKNYVVSQIDFDYDKEKYSRSKLEKVEMSTFFKHQFDYDSMFVHPQISVGCANLNGENVAATLFIAGQLYSYEDEAITLLYTPKIMGQTFNTMMDGSIKASRSYVAGVTAGNFTGNNAGREQFVYTVAFKESGKGDYAYYYGILGGCKYDDNGSNYGSLGGYFESDIRGGSGKYTDNEKETNASCVLYDKGDNWIASNKFCNCVIVAVDSDDDGIVGRYAGKDYAYSDPEIVAVLQAAPYFDEVGDEGETSYSITVEYEQGTSTETSGSVSYKVMAEFETDFVEGGVEIGSSHGWSKGYESSRTTSFTTSFSAEGEDQVIIKRIPVITYSYDLYDAQNKKWVENSYSISTPAEPVYYQMTIDEYNDFVDTFNEKYAKGNNSKYAMEKITEEDIPLDTAGNPYGYYSAWKNADSSAHSLSDSKTLKSLSYAGGSSSCEWAEGTGSSVSRSRSTGFTMSLELKLGEGILGSGVKAGAGVELENEVSTGWYTTTSNEKGSGGSVTNLSRKALMEDGLDDKTIQAYGFKWDFGSWTRTINGSQVNFFGYIVTDITAPPVAVNDLDVEMLDDVPMAEKKDASKEQGNEETMTTLRLTWSDPAEEGGKRAANKGFNIYRVYDNEYKYIGKAGKGVTTYDYTDIDGSLSYTFVVRTVGSDGDTESINSNEVSYRWEFKGKDGVGIKDIELYKSDGATDYYRMIFTDGRTFEYQVNNGRNGGGTSISDVNVNVTNTGGNYNFSFTFAFSDGTSKIATATIPRHKITLVYKGVGGTMDKQVEMYFMTGDSIMTFHDVVYNWYSSAWGSATMRYGRSMNYDELTNGGFGDTITDVFGSVMPDYDVVFMYTPPIG